MNTILTWTSRELAAAQLRAIASDIESAQPSKFNAIIRDMPILAVQSQAGKWLCSSEVNELVVEQLIARACAKVVGMGDCDPGEVAST